MMENVKSNATDAPKIVDMLEDWEKRGNLTKEEHRALKTAETNLKKFCESVFNRMNPKEQDQLKKKLTSFDFRLIDDFTLQRVYREISDHMKVASVPRYQFETWCEEIMDIRCKGCQQNWSECELHKIFENNLVPESSWAKDNCRYAYDVVKKKVG
jgi:hypothetical protein